MDWNIKDISGQKFGRIRVIKQVGRNKGNQVLWLCRCDCGNLHTTAGTFLITGGTRSCGCLQRESVGKRVFRHGMRHSSEYGIWCCMLSRCYNKNYKGYFNYGNRGIRVCDEWRRDFRNFYRDMGKKPERTSLDRINNDGDYTPSNCRWATREEQLNNKRTNRFLTFGDQRFTIAQWSRKNHIGESAIRRRLKLGWSIERTLTQTLRPHKHAINRAFNS